jgi:hypothetical protein
MLEIRIVCSHDAAKFAADLMRLLDAEQYRVRVSPGRRSGLELEQGRAEKNAVLLIWSADARSQTYMHDWARAIAPGRLIELARAPGAPRLDHHAPVIDFSSWRGERGCRAWNTLSERLRLVERALNPPKPPPKQAIAAMGMASIAAVAGAFMVRMNTPDAPAPESNELTLVDEEVAMGGALEAIEPASVGDWVPPLQRIRFTPLRTPPSAPLPRDIAALELPELRDATLLERLDSLNPLRLMTRDDS